MCGDEPEYEESERIAARAFPTCVGMNRQMTCSKRPSPCVPYMCGDEPQASRRQVPLQAAAFPTCVGMNRGMNYNADSIRSVPYMCGDEPRGGLRRSYGM